MSIIEFREEARDWLAEHVPASLKGSTAYELFSGGSKGPIANPDVRKWFDLCYERGWAVPGWPKEYGGGGLDRDQVRVLREEMARAGAPAPLSDMGVSMIGPTLLEHGNEEQRKRFLTKTASGEIRWCQGYSEPNAGSDLASLQTRAVDNGDYYVVNGSKIWTSGANFADWIFCLVRTDAAAPKHEGISFVLFSMDDPGVTIKPIKLIAGNSPFCQCFFDDVKVPKTDLIGQENRGWTIAKRLLQHERSSISGFDGANGGEERDTLPSSAKQYAGEENGRITDAVVRRNVTQIEMDALAFALTGLRAMQENTTGGTPTFATSMFKYYGTELSTRRMEALIQMRGTQGVGWEGDSFASDEIDDTRNWLFGKAFTIAGGSSEVQLNIIAKRVLGLPD